MSIHDTLNKIKGVYTESPNILYISAIIALVAIGSFFLGRISASTNTNKANISILYNKDSNLANAYSGRDIAANSTQNINSVANELSKDMYVASKNGKLYYTNSCKAASRLSDKNKVWFSTKLEAENAGYVFAESCNK